MGIAVFSLQKSFRPDPLSRGRSSEADKASRDYHRKFFQIGNDNESFLHLKTYVTVTMQYLCSAVEIFAWGLHVNHSANNVQHTKMPGT
ncbi:hypothetical protein [Pseudomonas huanghezhanensis]|uniref:hypothetical protein n=1 Tax=Pseudomonas huanghezhanensis TaxID=3002903 RepID=UPI0022868D53|nr:hypothetical protein [Pseudomonas sp. BSw22131]